VPHNQYGLSTAGDFRVQRKAYTENFKPASGDKDLWYHGIDYLRSFMSLAVIAWHLRLFGETGFFHIDEYETQTICWVDFIYFHVLLLAVPAFYLISLFMFSNRQVVSVKYLMNRLERLTYLYLFWLGAGLLIYLYLTGNSISALYHFSTSSIQQFALSFFSGWFTPYYFFVNLIMLTIVSYFTVTWNYRVQWLMMVFSLLQLWIFSALVRRLEMCEYMIAYWNFFNFIPYVFVSNLIIHYQSRLNSLFVFKWLIIILTLSCVITAYCEWHWFLGNGNFKYNDFALPPYMRISVVIGASLLFVLSLRLRYRAPKWVKFLSDNSLGLYCLHLIVMIVLQKFEGYQTIHQYRILEFLIVISISIVLSLILRRAFRTGLI
jgi:surface polysaccharide O-acyltransferase-like enzyme